MPGGPSEERGRFDFQLGEFRIHVNLRSGKLVVSRAARKDLAHLTLSWRNRSGEIDIHLTRRHEQATLDGHGTDDYEPLFRLAQSEVEELGVGVGEASRQFFVDLVRTKWRRFRPGWLARNGYVLVQIEPAAFDHALKRAAPKKRRKYRVDLEMLENGTWVAKDDVAFYDASALHDLRHTERERPVQVVRVSDGRTDRILLRHGRGPNGSVGWWGAIDREVMASSDKLQDRLLEWARPLVRAEHADKFEQIVQGLALEDTSFGRNLAASVRRFIRDARNQEARPVRRAETATSPSP